MVNLRVKTCILLPFRPLVCPTLVLALALALALTLLPALALVLALATTKQHTANEIQYTTKSKKQAVTTFAILNNLSPIARYTLEEPAT